MGKKVLYNLTSKYRSQRGGYILGVTRPGFVYPIEVEERDDGILIRRYNGDTREEPRPAIEKV